MQAPEKQNSPFLTAFKRISRFLDKVLIVCALSIGIFTVAMIVVFCIYGSTPDILIENFFKVFGIEGIACAVITIVKTVTNKLINAAVNEDSDEESEDISE